MITTWRSDNSYKHKKSGKTVPLSITQIEQEVEKVLFTMWEYQSLGYRYCNTINSSARHQNDGDEIYEEEGM